MLVNGFTVFAQIINFLILVVLLKRFLYGPIVNAMEQREAAIVNHVREASLQLENAENEALIYQKKQQELEQQKQNWLLQAKQEVIEEKKILLAKAQEEIENTKSQWYEQLEREKQVYFSDLHRVMSQQIMAITSHILADLAGSELEEQIVNIFIRRLGISELSLVSSEELLISTSHALNLELQEKLIHAIGQYLGKQVQVEFQVRPELICGIELTTPGYQVDWNLQHYLTGLVQALSV